MLKIYLTGFILMLLSLKLGAQHTFFPESGRITYERKFHLKNYLNRTISNPIERDETISYIAEGIGESRLEQFITKHTLTFSGGESLYEARMEDLSDEDKYATFFSPIGLEAKTYMNNNTGRFARLLSFEDEELLMEDSIPVIKWKYTDEYRDIAGYACRRANGLVQDSIYVVAFFTNQIARTGGPELVQGLPGMVLGLSVPAFNINMFAIKVELVNIPISAQLTKSKKVVPQSLESTKKKLRTSVFSDMEEADFQKQWSSVLF